MLASTLAYAWFRLSGSTTCSINCDVKARCRAIAADRLGSTELTEVNSTTGPGPVPPSPVPSWRGDDGEGPPCTASTAFVCCIVSIEFVPSTALASERFGPSSARPHDRPLDKLRAGHAREASPSAATDLGLLRPLLTSAIRYGIFQCCRSLRRTHAHASTGPQISQGKLLVLNAGHAGFTPATVRMSVGVPIHCSVTRIAAALYPVPVRHVRVAVIGFLQTLAHANALA